MVVQTSDRPAMMMGAMTSPSMPMTGMMPGVMPGMANLAMVPRCTVKMEKCKGGMKMTCSCSDDMACATLQNLCKMLCDGLCSVCCCKNGMCVCQCNLFMCSCECSMTEDGCCITCTSGDKSSCEMIQACCDCLCACMEAGCMCCICFNNTPVCCGTC